MQNAFEIISFIASISSLIVSAGAIWLSIVFFKMSDQAAKETTKSSDKIQSSVDKLEKLFDKLYSDTFSMMKDTVGDMRQHIYHSPEKMNTLEYELNNIKSSLEKEFKEIIENKLKGAVDNEKKISELEIELSNLIEKKINKAIDNDEKKSIEVEEQILRFISINKKVTLSSILGFFKIRVKSESKIYDILFNLRARNKITWDGESDQLSSTDIITITKNGSRS